MGADFLSHFGLLVDCQGMRLIDDTTKLHSVCSVVADSDCESISPVVVLPDLADANVRTLLQRFPSLYMHTQPGSNSQSKIRQHHVIETTSDRPVFAKARQLNNEKYHGMLSPRQNSIIFCKRESFALQTAHGLRHFIWCQSKMGHGVPVGISDV